jgi:hypothetical protein
LTKAASALVAKWRGALFRDMLDGELGLLTTVRNNRSSSSAELRISTMYALEND